MNIRSQVTMARNKGEIVPKPCEVCGKEKTVGHHDDYNKPLEVRWLCYKHHAAEHARLKREGKSIPGRDLIINDKTSTVYPVRLSADLLRKVQIEAKRDSRTVAGLIRHLLILYIKQEGGGKQ